MQKRNRIVGMIKNVAKRVCGISKSGHNQKTTWWWNEEVKEVIKEKRPAIKRTLLGYEKER